MPQATVLYSLEENNGRFSPGGVENGCIYITRLFSLLLSIHVEHKPMNHWQIDQSLYPTPGSFISPVHPRVGKRRIRKTV
jgi:hypothetical protein